MVALDWFLAACVLAGALPLLAGCYQFALAGLNRLRLPQVDARRERRFPHIAVVIPAWNEAQVIGRTLDRLAQLDYPRDRLRIYVVDDASTDATPELVRAKAREHPGLVHHLRREHGGQGKAHTINHGLRLITAEEWYEAVLVIDADVIFTSTALERMTARLGVEGIGAVTAYIKEGTRPAKYLNRFVAYEYITAQAAARRAQNVLGAQACLAGGAQLIDRASLEAIGGQIDTSTLAEDTVTTLSIQLAGRRVFFEPSAIVWAEEPQAIDGLWKQRVRWARGNAQVTARFRSVWFHRGRGPLGGVSFGLIWFSIFLMPFLMILASAALVTLFFVDRQFSVDTFKALWALNLFTYLFVTLSSFSIDFRTARAAWREAIMFPGLVSLLIILYALYPPLVDDHLAGAVGAGPDGAAATALLLFTYVWLAGSMLAASLVKALEKTGRAAWLVPPLLYVVGFGPLLCAMTSAAYLRELRGAEMRWEKTEKVGRIGDLA